MHIPNSKEFPIKSVDKLRYADTDAQGHVNNATFATFLETGRVEFLYDSEQQIRTKETSFVIASLKLSFIQEILWPGEVEIGTGLLKIGNSSIKVYQAIFQKGECKATAESIIVQVSDATRKSVPLNEEVKKRLEKLRWNKG